MTNSAIPEGTVAVHRWFAGGEGWAMHPELAQRLNDVTDAVAPALRSPSGEFVVPALGGFLVGEKLDDSECLDLKARDRHPTIVRMTLLTHQPSSSLRQDVLAKLGRLPIPTRAGADARLVLPGYNAALESAQKSATPNRGLVWASAAGAAVVCLALFVWAITRPGAEANGVTPTPNDVRPDDGNKPPANGNRPGGSEADLTPIEGELPYLNDRTRAEFRRKWEAVKMYDHPYIAFLDAWADRLPASAPKCKTVDDVRAGLRGLLGHIRPGEPVDNLTPSQLRDSIDQLLSYESWRARIGPRGFEDGAKPLPDGVRRFVHTFRRPDPGLDQLTKRMAELLELWRESGALVEQTRDPFATIDRFFALLVRPVKLPSPAKVDHPKVAFLVRLPSNPIAEGLCFNGEDDLAKSLRHLLYLLDRETDPHANTPGLDTLNRIAEQLRYSEWLAKRSKQTFRDLSTNLPEVERECRRFE